MSRRLHSLTVVLSLVIFSVPLCAESLRFVVISDSNDRYGSEFQGLGVPAAVRMILEQIQPEFVIHNGDMIAGQSRRLNSRQVRAMWRGYHNEVTWPLANEGIPLIPVPGNHDAAPSKRYVDRPIYDQQWRKKANRPAIRLLDDYRYPFSYTFAVKNVLFMVIDGAVGRVPQWDLPWIAMALKDASSYDAVLVFSHVPFAKLLDRSYGTLRPSKKLYRLFRRHRVVLFSGHYELFYRGYYRGLPIVSTGQLSHTCRVPINGTICQGMSFLVLEFNDGVLKELHGLKGPGFDGLFDASQLPLELGDYWRPSLFAHDLDHLVARPPISMDLRDLTLP